MSIQAENLLSASLEVIIVGHLQMPRTQQIDLVLDLKNLVIHLLVVLLLGQIVALHLGEALLGESFQLVDVFQVSGVQVLAHFFFFLVSFIYLSLVTSFKPFEIVRIIVLK